MGLMFITLRNRSLPILLALMFLSPTAVRAQSAAAPGEQEKELFVIAQRAFDDGFYDVAIRYINDFLEKYPESEKKTQAKLLIGQCYFFKTQYLKAFEIFQGLTDSQEFKDATLFWLGETYLKGSDFAKAEQYYKEVINLFPKSPYTPQSFYSLAWTYFEQKKYLLALDTFKELIQKFPEHQLTEDAHFKAGECEYNLRSYAEAIERFQDYIIKYPKSNRQDQAFFYIAESYYYQPNYSEAITYYGKASQISLDPKLVVMAKVSMGWSFFKKGDYPNAQQAFADAKATAGEKKMLSDDIFLGEASLYTEMGDHAKALEAYNTLIDNFPKSPRLVDAYLGKANMQYMLKDYPAAIATYTTLLQNFAAQEDQKELIEKAYFGLAWAQLKSGQIDAAIKNFEMIMDRTDNKTVKVSALTQIGDAYQDAGNLDKALEVYDRILQNYPDSLYSDYVQYRQGIALLKMGKIDAATLSFQTLRANFPKSKFLTDSLYYLGVAYFKKNDWARTKEQVESFLKETSSSPELIPEAHYILALSQYNLEDSAGALKTFDKIIRDFTDDPTLTQQSELGSAKALYKTGDAKEAVKKFKIIIYKYPQTETALNAMMWLGDYYLENSEFESAIDFYQQVIANFPNNKQLSLAHYKLGQAYQVQGFFDKAINEYKVIDDPQDKELYAKAKLAIAEIFSKELDLTTAIETYKTIAVNCPEMKRDAYLKISAAYITDRKFEDARAALEQALNSELGLSEITNAELQFKTGDVYELMNKTNESVEAYLKIPYLYPKETYWVTKAYLRVGRIFENQEDWANAKTIYQKVIALGTDEVKFAQERLDWIQSNIGIQ